jgi:HEAT repeat protein
VTHPILARLANGDADERQRACLEAEHDPSAVLLVPALAAALGDESQAVARAASQTLAALGRQHGAVRDALREALRTPEPRRRMRAAFTLARLEPPEPRSLPALVAALDAEDGDVRWTATRILVEMGRAHGEVLRVLLSLAGDASPRVRRMALAGLRELAPDEPVVARTLLSASRDADPGVRRAALTALAALVAPPAAVRERLVETAASDPDAATRRLAEVALGVVDASHPAASPR